MTIRRILMLTSASLLTLGAGCQSSTTPVSTDVSFVDMHAHIYPTTQTENAQYIDDIVTTGKANGVSQIVLGLHARHEPERTPTYSTEHDAWVLAAAEKYPGYIIPALNGFDPATGDVAVTYVSEQLATGKWKMIGELDLRNRPKKTTTPANTDTMMRIYTLAAQYEVPVMLHYDSEYGTTKAAGDAELEQAIASNPNTTFIFAHSCGTNVASLMAEYANIYCEQEFIPVAPGIDMARVVLGTDIQVHGAKPENSAEEYKGLLAKLRAAIAGWDSADVTRAAAETPAALLNL